MVEIKTSSFTTIRTGPFAGKRIGRLAGAMGAIVILALGYTSSAVGAAPELGINAPQRPSHVSGATIAVEGRLVSYTDAGLKGPVTTSSRLTLHITGAHFRAGGRVTIVILNTANWLIPFRGSTIAQNTAVSRCNEYGCTEPDPMAGAIDLRIHLDNAPNTSNLEVLFRSGQQIGMRGVTFR